MFGESEIHIFNLFDMTIKKQRKISSKYFGEGSDFVYYESENKTVVYQLTWKSRKILLFNENLEFLEEINLPREMVSGWGLVHWEDKTENETLHKFYATDGSNKIFIIDAKTFKVIKTFKIYHNKKPIYYLNELEIIGDYLFIRFYDVGVLTKEIIETPYFRQRNFGENECLNGIAHNKKTNKTYITGKRWPIIYEIEFLN